MTCLLRRGETFFAQDIKGDNNHMWIWILMLFFCLLIPIMMIVFGRVMLKRPPQKINDYYGYRTTMSRKNKETWVFAHQVCGKLWWKIGWIMFLLSGLILLPFIKSNEDIVGIAGTILITIQCLILILSILPVEKALKQNFNPDGSRK